jgi:3-oxoacyl-[acyl-carrier protein] reductase
MTNLSGQAALVTGGNQGIGWAIAATLAAHGARVAVNYPDEERYPSRLAELPGEAVAIMADVSRLDGIASLFATFDALLGPIDLLVTNAGIFPRADLLKLDEATWDAVHSLNLKGTFFCAQAAARRMVPRKTGRIITIASDSALVPDARGAHYCASKAGVVALTKSLALALAPHGILVNALAPGLTDTAQPRDGMTEEEIATYGRERIPLGRIAQPEDIARAALYLAGPLSDFMTGETLFVNGGSLMVP